MSFYIAIICICTRKCKFYDSTDIIPIKCNIFFHRVEMYLVKNRQDRPVIIS